MRKRIHKFVLSNEKHFETHNTNCLNNTFTQKWINLTSNSFLKKLLTLPDKTIHPTIDLFSVYCHFILNLFCFHLIDINFPFILNKNIFQNIILK